MRKKKKTVKLLCPSAKDVNTARRQRVTDGRG